MVTERERNTFLARLCEQAERYDEMVTYMKEVAKEAKEITVDERNLLSVAYKNVIGTRRASWRLIVSIEQKEEQKGNSKHLAQVTAYKQKIEKELEDICNEVLSFVDECLLPHASDGESKVFYYKLMGDYHRYLAEFAHNDKKQSAADAAHKAYQKASEIAQDVLSPTHPIRLGLALNYSVFYYEILNSASKACELAKQAFDDAISELDSLPEELYRDSTLIMQLLRDNLSYWASTEQQDVNEAAEAAAGAAPSEDVAPDAGKA